MIPDGFVEAAVLRPVGEAGVDERVGVGPEADETDEQQDPFEPA